MSLPGAVAASLLLLIAAAGSARADSLEPGVTPGSSLDDPVPTTSPRQPSKAPSVPRRSPATPSAPQKSAAPTSPAPQTPPGTSPTGTEPGSTLESAPATVLPIEGTVLERGSADPLDGVTLTIAGQEPFETDGRGRYTVALPAGRYRVRVTLPGYVPAQIDVVVPGKGRVQPPVFLEPRQDRQRPIQVEAQRDRREINLEILTPEALERTPGTFGDPLRAVESLPNVARSGFLDGSIVVRGAEPRNTAVLLDGHPLPFLFHFGFWKSVINPFFVDSVRFYPGGLPSSFGNVLQAVLDVRARESAMDRPHGAADVNLTDSSFFLSAPLLKGKLRLAGAARYSYTSLLLRSGEALFGTSVYVVPRYSDYQLRLDADLGSGRLSVLSIGAGDTVVLDPGPASTPVYEEHGVDPSIPFQTRFDHLHLNYRRTIAGVEVSTSTLVGRDFQVSLLPYEDELLRLPALTRLERWVLGERAEASWRPSSALGLNAGLELRYSRANLRDLVQLYYAPSDPPPPEELKQVFLGGIYGRIDLMPAKAWLVLPELRGTVYAYNDRVTPLIEPRLTVRRALKGDVRLKAAVGVFSQIPEEREYSRWQGNPDLELMKAVQGAAGVEAPLPWRLQVESTVFASRMWDLTLSRRDIVYVDTEYGKVYRSVEQFFVGDGWGYGGEVTLKRPAADRITGSISYAYTRSLRDTTDGTIPGDYDQPHTLTVMGAAHLPRRWTLSTRFRWASGQPYTPLHGAWSGSDGAWLPVYGPLNSAREHVYHQLDVRVDRDILRKYWRLNLYLDVQNVYMARNEVFRVPAWNYNGTGAFIWVPLVPTFGAKGVF